MGGTTSYWNNPNHISLSPSINRQPAVYSVPENYFYSNQYRTTNYQGPSYGGSYSYTGYSPSKYQPASYTPQYGGMNAQPSYSPGYSGYQAPMTGGNEFSYSTLLQNIDRALEDPAPKGGMYNTLDRANVSFRPNFEMHTQYAPSSSPMDKYSKPPLYQQKQRSFSQKREEGISSMNDFYNRKPFASRYGINYSHKPITPYVKPSSPLKSARQPSPHFQRSSRSVHRPASDFEIRDAVQTLFR